LENLGIYGSTISKLILKNRIEGVDWINVARYRDEVAGFQEHGNENGVA
jgi:hypothetical protein